MSYLHVCDAERIEEVELVASLVKRVKAVDIEQEVSQGENVQILVD